MNNSTKPLRPVNQCHRVAPCGHPCCLLPTSKHTYHICDRQDCLCHRPQRYLGIQSLRATETEISRRRGL